MTMKPAPVISETLREAVDDWHTHRSDARRAIICAPVVDSLLDPALLYSLGIHPWNAADATPELLALLRVRAEENNVVAIGEAGLDRLRGPSLEIQHPVFEAQARIADEVSKPLIIHSVRTVPEVISLHKRMSPSVPWIIHGFRGGPDAARQLLARPGIYISLGSRFRADAEAVIPPERLLRETDCDFRDN